VRYLLVSNRFFSLPQIKKRLPIFQFRGMLLLQMFLVMAALISASKAVAQGTGGISGYVGDTTKAMIPGVTITAVMTEQQTSWTAQANREGFYGFVALPPGHYNLTFQADGFSRLLQSNIEVTVGQNVRVDAQLAPGSVQSEVDVSSTVPLLDTTSSTLSGLVDDRRVVDLPLNGRNIMSLAGVLPGVTNVSAPQTMSDARSGAGMDVSGSLPNSAVYTFDGAFFNNPSRNTGINFPPPDAIAQFRMLTTNFDAEYGHNSGAQVEVVSKAGTDSFHGAAFEFLRNDALNAHDYFATSVPSEKQNQFGGTIGGPILKKGLFFFASYQGLTDHHQAESTQALVPSVLERSGNFAGENVTLTDPTDSSTGLPMTDANGNPCVSNNQIAVGCISPVATNLLNYVPSSPSGTVVSLAASPITDNTGMIRIDWSQSTKNLIYGHYYRDQNNYSTPFAGGGNIPGYIGENFQVGTQDVVVNDIFTFTPTLINQAIFSLLDSTSSELESKTITPSTLGINIPQYVPSGAITVNVANNFTLGSGNPTQLSGLNYQIGDNLSWTKERHTFKFGFELLKFHFYQSYISPPSISFSGVRSGNPVADFILGAYDTTNVAFGLAVNDNRTAYNSFYAQDQYRVRPNLTISAGVRYDPFLPWKAANNALDTMEPGVQSKVDPTAPPGIVFPGDPGITKGISPAELKNFAPRLGLAWDVRGDGKTSVRAGYGLFYNSINADSLAQINAPFAGTENAYRGNIGDPYGSTGLANPPTKLTNTFGCSPISTYPYYSCPLFPLPLTGLYISTNLRLPYYQEYDLSIQRQITPTVMAEVAYVGNIGRDVSGYVPNNPALFKTDPITGQAPSEGNVNDRVAYEPGILSPQGVLYKNYAHSSYNALELQATKRFGHGSTVIGSYTYAKSLDMISVNNSSGNVANPLNLNASYGRSDFDRRNSFVVSWLYEMPFHFSHPLEDHLLGGWTLTAIQSVESGTPISFYAGQDVALDGTGYSQYAELASGADASTINLNHPNRAAMVSNFFNTQAFVAPNLEPLGIYGNSSKGMISGPAYANTDASLLKTFAVHEALKLQFRLESFNTFNQVNFSNPNSYANSGAFGKIQSTSSGTGRQLQLALKAIW
jgi:hypothetical protein